MTDPHCGPRAPSHSDTPETENAHSARPRRFVDPSTGPHAQRPKNATADRRAKRGWDSGLLDVPECFEARPLILADFPRSPRRRAQLHSREKEKAVAQAIPLLGAAGGATINLLFMDHFQHMARGHFIVRRLERAYGKELIRETYQRMASRN